MLYELRNECNVIVLKTAAARSLPLPVHPRSGHVAFYSERLIVRMTRIAARDDWAFLGRSMGVDRSCPIVPFAALQRACHEERRRTNLYSAALFFVSLLTRAFVIVAVLLLISEAYIKLCGQDEVVIHKDQYELNVSVCATVDNLNHHKHCLRCLYNSEVFWVAGGSQVISNNGLIYWNKCV